TRPALPLLTSTSRLNHWEGDNRRARSRLAEAVVFGRNHGVISTAWEGLCLLGVIAIDERAFATGLRLISAALAHVPLTEFRPRDRAELEDSLATARSALGDEADDRIWAEGQAMTLDQAIASGLQEGGA